MNTHNFAHHCTRGIEKTSESDNAPNYLHICECHKHTALAYYIQGLCWQTSYPFKITIHIHKCSGSKACIHRPWLEHTTNWANLTPQWWWLTECHFILDFSCCTNSASVREWCLPGSCRCWESGPCVCSHLQHMLFAGLGYTSWALLGVQQTKPWWTCTSGESWNITNSICC